MKGGLANQLLGKTVVPKPNFGDPATQGSSYPDVNGKFWVGLKPDMSGKYHAVIDAAWTEEGKVKLAVHDPFGNTATMWFEYVNLATY